MQELWAKVSTMGWGWMQGREAAETVLESRLGKAEASSWQGCWLPSTPAAADTPGAGARHGVHAPRWILLSRGPAVATRAQGQGSSLDRSVSWQGPEGCHDGLRSPWLRGRHACPQQDRRGVKGLPAFQPPVTRLCSWLSCARRACGCRGRAVPRFAFRAESRPVAGPGRAGPVRRGSEQQSPCGAHLGSLPGSPSVTTPRQDSPALCTQGPAQRPCSLSTSENIVDFSLK